MTANELKYWELEENKRAHRAGEAISQQQADAATSQAETARLKHKEDVRTHKVNESIGWSQATAANRKAAADESKASAAHVKNQVDAYKAGVAAGELQYKYDTIPTKATNPYSSVGAGVSMGIYGLRMLTGTMPKVLSTDPLSYTGFTPAPIYGIGDSIANAKNPTWTPESQWKY